MPENDNLPIKQNNGLLSIENKRNLKRLSSNVDRIGKIGASIAIAFAGLVGTVVFTIPVASAIGTGVSVLALTTAANLAIFKKDEDLLFVTRKNLSGQTTISQDALDFRGVSLMKGFSPSEKGALMGLQALVALERFKQEFQDKHIKKVPSKDGKSNVYKPVFVTSTHGINIKTFESLEKLGYIEIESLKDVRKSYLIFEKLGFGQTKDAYKSAKSVFIGKNKELRKQIKKIKFRLTDKPFDFEKVYEHYLTVKDTKGENPERKPLKRLGIIFDILEKRNIDIQRDELKIPFINYKSPVSFATRKKADRVARLSRDDFSKRIEDVDINTPDRIAEQELMKKKRDKLEDSLNHILNIDKDTK